MQTTIRLKQLLRIYTAFLFFYAFSVAMLSVWNSLPDNIRLCTSTDTFKRHLKTPTCLTSLSLVPPSASVSSDFMALYKYCIIITNIIIIM